MEGETDKSVIPYLMEANGVAWPDPPRSPVFIEPSGSVDELLQPGVIEIELAASGLEALGVVVDANGDAAGRWDDVKTWCSSEFADLPEQIPAGGLEVVHSDGVRFGVWIMPDNRLTGMLEDFLVQLVPDGSGSCTNWPGMPLPRRSATMHRSGMCTRERQRFTRGSRGRTRRICDCTKP